MAMISYFRCDYDNGMKYNHFSDHHNEIGHMIANSPIFFRKIMERTDHIVNTHRQNISGKQWWYWYGVKWQQVNTT